MAEVEEGLSYYLLKRWRTVVWNLWLMIVYWDGNDNFSGRV